MAKTSLILTTTDILGRKQQKSFTDINPEADTAALKTFAQMCNNLTTNTYIQTDRIDKINCDTEAGTSKTAPTFTVSKTTFSKASAGSGASNENENGYTTNSEWVVHWTVTYNGDGALSFTPVAGISVGVDKTDATTYSFLMSMPKTQQPLPQTMTIGATETDNYKAATPITITFTA